MKRVLVWDLPVRFFHWLLAATFTVAFLIPLVFGDDGSIFAVHMLMGGVAAFMILLRIVWGLVGSRWARLGSLALRPQELFSYTRDAFTGRDRRYAGHNPGSSIATVLMFVLILGLAFTGVMMGNGGGEAYEEIHELLAWSMGAVVAVHVAGIVWHTLRHRENISLSMIDGRKQADAADAIPSSHPVIGLIFLVLTGLWTAGLVDGYDAATNRVTLPLTGQTLQVGEGDQDDGRDYEDEYHERDD